MPPAAMNDEHAVEIDREYDAWLVRLSQTYESVQYCCRYRLGDPALAERAAVEVIAGLLARPQVWQYFGLPFSGRVAKLTEQCLAEVPARAGSSAVGAGFDEVRDALAALPPPDRMRFVEMCVEGHDEAALATAMDCSEETARRGWAQTLGRLRDIADRAIGGERDAARLE